MGPGVTVLWYPVKLCVQEGATEEKAVLEDKQRQEEKARKTTGQEWVPQLFERGPDSRWVYKHQE